MTRAFEIQVALVGCGAISILHLAGLTAQTDLKLVALIDPDLQAAQALAKEAQRLTGQPEPAIFADLAAAFKTLPIDAVHILTPHNTHADLACIALAHGCHVLVEKPAAMDAAELQKLAAAAQIAEGQLGVCLQNRYNYASQQAHQYLTENRFGRVISTRAFVTWWRDTAYYSESPWRGRWHSEGGSLMINQALHTLDLMTWLVGDVTQVTGHIFNDHLQNVIETEDTATALLTFHNGATGVFFATTAYLSSAEPLLEIVCEQAVLRIEGSDRLTVYDRQGQLLPGFTQPVAGPVHPAAVLAAQLLPEDKAYWGKSHAILIAEFYQHLRAEKNFPIDLAEGSRALKILFAWYQSSQSGSMLKLS